MQVLTVVALLVASASAQWASPYWNVGYGYGAPYYGYAAPEVRTSQFHAQDEFGQFSYGYAGGPSSKNEVRTLDGVTRGSYNYIDANNKVQTVSYIADPINGFRVEATNLPKAPVADLKAPVFNLKAPVHDAPLPIPVHDTPEVAAAKAEHQRAYDVAAAAAAEAPDTRRKRDLTHITYAVPAIGEAKLKYVSLEGVDAPVPASTRLLELKEREHTIKVPTLKTVKYELPKIQPLSYAAPLAYGYGHGLGLGYSLGYGYHGLPLTLAKEE